jgi:hypothetical protein
MNEFGFIRDLLAPLARPFPGSLDLSDDAAVFAVPNEPHRQRCEPTRSAVENALAAHFGRPVPVRLEVEGSSPAPARQPEPAVEDDVDVSDLIDAPAAVTSDLTPLMQHFPGAVEVEE